MISEDEVRSRLRYLVREEFDRRVQIAHARLPRSCKYNHLHSLDNRKTVNGEVNPNYNRIDQPKTIGLCMYGSENDNWPGDICEDPIDAKRCPLFTVKVTRATLFKEFKEQLADLEWVQASMPEAYGLLRILGDTRLPELSWWKRWLFKIRWLRPEPLHVNLAADLECGPTALKDIRDV